MKKRKNFKSVISNDLLPKLIDETKSQVISWIRIDNNCECSQFNLNLEDFNFELRKINENRNDYSIILKARYKNNEGDEVKYSTEEGKNILVKQLFDCVSGSDV